MASLLVSQLKGIFVIAVDDKIVLKFNAERQQWWKVILLSADFEARHSDYGKRSG